MSIFKFKSKAVRIIEDLLKYEADGGKLMGDECLFISDLLLNNNEILYSIDYLQKGILLNSLACRVAYWRHFLKDQYKELGMKKKAYVTFLHSIAKDCEDPDVCYCDAVELLKSKSEEGFSMLHKAAFFGSYLAQMALYEWYQKDSNTQATALYWLYKAYKNIPQDGSVKEDDIMLMHLKIADQLAGARIEYIFRSAAEEKCGYAAFDAIDNGMEGDKGPEYFEMAVNDGISTIVVNAMISLLKQGDISNINNLEQYAARGNSIAVCFLADAYSGAINIKGIAPDETKAKLYNDMALSFNYPQAIRYFIDHCHGIHKEFFKFRLKSLNV